MLRYFIIIVAFILIILYVISLASKGVIPKRFRMVSFILLGILLIFLSLGLYYNYRHYSLQTIQGEFAANKDSIINQIQNYYHNEKYTQARELAEKYVQVQDQQLRKLYKKSRQAELLKQAEKFKGKHPQKVLLIWKELAKLTKNPKYQQLIQKQKEKLQKQKENYLLDKVNKLPPKAISAKALGYKNLQQLKPDKSIYKQQYDNLMLKIREKIQNSPWSDICSSSSIPYCSDFGHMAMLSNTENELGYIMGVSWRPKGTLISRKGQTAPEDSYYYIVSTKTNLVLYKADYIQTQNPFEGIQN